MMNAEQRDGRQKTSGLTGGIERRIDGFGVEPGGGRAVDSAAAAVAARVAAAAAASAAVTVSVDRRKRVAFGGRMRGRRRVARRVTIRRTGNWVLLVSVRSECVER